MKSSAILLFIACSLGACTISPHHAVLTNDLHYLEQLTPEDVNDGHLGSGDWTALHLAANENKLQAIDILLGKGANPNAYSLEAGAAPIHLAVFNGHFDMVAKLLSLKVDLEVKNKAGATPLELSIIQDNEKIFDILVDGHAEINTKNSEGITPLMIAAIYNRGSIIEKLLRSGADLNAVNNSYDNVLIISARENATSLNTFRLLLEKKIHLDKTNNYGDTALHWSVSKGNAEKTRMLLAAGADTEVKNSAGLTAKDLGVSNTTILGLFNAFKADDELLTEPDFIPQIESPKIARLLSTATAFVVNERAGLITNFHAVEQCSDVKIFKNSKEYSAKLVHSDVSNDLAYLVASDLAGSKFVNISVAPKQALGERLVVLGYPLTSLMGNTVKLTDGTLSSQTGLGGDSSVYQISAPIQAGNSGGPVFNEQGYVIGVATSTLNASYMLESRKDIPQNVNFAVKSSILSTFLSVNDLEYHSGSSDKKGVKSPKEVFSNNSGAVAMVLCYKNVLAQ